MTCPLSSSMLHAWQLSAALASTSFNHAHLNGLQHRNTGRRGFRARGRLRAPVSAPRKRPSAAGDRSCVSPETWVPANVLSWCLLLPVAFLNVQPYLMNKFDMPDVSGPELS